MQTEASQDVAFISQEADITSHMSWGDVYGIGRLLTGVIVFAVCWIYAIVSFGWFLGIGLGWIPSLVIAGIAGFLWPVIAVAVAGVVIVVIILVTRG